MKARHAEQKFHELADEPTSFTDDNGVEYKQCMRHENSNVK